MKRCYIAGKIGDSPESEYKPKFEQAKADVTAMGFVPVSPVDLPHNHGRTWPEYMREDITELMTCDVLYALRDWRLSPGARIEIETALNVGIDIIHEKPQPLS